MNRQTGNRVKEWRPSRSWRSRPWRLGRRCRWASWTAGWWTVSDHRLDAAQGCSAFRWPSPSFLRRSPKDWSPPAQQENYSTWGITWMRGMIEAKENSEKHREKKTVSYHWDWFDFKPFQDPREAICSDVGCSLNPHCLQGRENINKTIKADVFNVFISLQSEVCTKTGLFMGFFRLVIKSKFKKCSLQIHCLGPFHLS